jgi:zinc protease
VRPADFGGHLGSHHDRDDLSYTFAGAAGNVASMLELLARRAPAMWVDPNAVASFDRETVPLLARLELAPEAQARRAFREAIFGRHPYGRTVVAGDLARLSAGDATGWLERTAVPRNAVLAIVGEIDPAEVEATVRDTFGRWSSAEPAQAPPAPPALPERAPKPITIVTHRPGATQGEIQLGCLLPPATASRARYDMMASLLQDRLTGVLRRSFGASYGFHAAVSTYRGGAADLVVGGAVDNEHATDALAAVRRAFILLSQGHFTPGELDAARWRTARAYGVRFATNASVVHAILAARNETRDLRSLDAYPEDLIAVTAEALQADFARCAGAEVLSLVGDEPTLRAALAQAWP